MQRQLLTAVKGGLADRTEDGLRGDVELAREFVRRMPGTRQLAASTSLVFCPTDT
jgi:hypothetical protein